MKDFEREFEQMVRANRGTIYTVCYMFSNDQDEVADLFQIFDFTVIAILFAICFYVFYREMRSLNKAVKEIDEFVNM